MWRKYLLLLAVLPFYTNAQTLTGMSGLLNIPSADMQVDGTFFAGVNYLPAINHTTYGNTNTENYYFNLTFLPFLEVAYKMTLNNNISNEFHQDRSASFRLQLIKESDYLPAITIGVNDFYTTAIRNQHFEANYLVFTKHFQIDHTDFGLTLGYGTDLILKKSQFVGLFGGLSISPAFFKPLKLMAEYDCKGINLGGSLLLFNHLYLFSMAQHLQYFAGGVACRIYL